MKNVKIFNQLKQTWFAEMFDTSDEEVQAIFDHNYNIPKHVEERVGDKIGDLTELEFRIIAQEMRLTGRIQRLSSKKDQEEFFLEQQQLNCNIKALRSLFRSLMRERFTGKEVVITKDGICELKEKEDRELFPPIFGQLGIKIMHTQP